jgi:hypothetical protein
MYKQLLGACLLIAAAVVVVAMAGIGTGPRLYFGTPALDCGELQPSDCRYAMERDTGDEPGPVT